MTGIIQGAKSIGMISVPPPPSLLPSNAEDPTEILASLISKVDELTTLVEAKADSNRLKTLIRYSPEAILIQAKDIALNGTVTFMDLWEDQSGIAPDTLHPSLTRIRGGVIQTEVIISSNWGATEGSAIDLDNGTITIGGSSNPKLKFDSTTGNLTISGTLQAGSIIAGSVTLNSGAGETLTSVQNNAQAGKNIQQALEVSGTTILKGVLVPTDAGALKVGTITWSSTTGALTGGTGIAITEFGIIGAASGTPTFTINAATGAATFAGALSAATGTFSGSISAASGTFTGSLVTTGQVYSTGTTTGTTSGLQGSIIGESASRHGVVGFSNAAGYAGIQGLSNGGATTAGVVGSGGAGAHGVMGVGIGTGFAIYADQNLSSSGALKVDGLSDINGNMDISGTLVVNGALTVNAMTKVGTTLVTNLNANYVGGYAASQIMKIGIDTLQDLANSDSWTKFQTSADGVTVASSIYVRKKVW